MVAMVSNERYPARIEATLDPGLSRWLWLVKWWLLAIPHYIIVGIFAGGGAAVAYQTHNNNVGWTGVGLIGLLTLVAVVVLLFTGRYPQSLYDFILGMDRWVVRVAAYASLMTDRYPPFRLDMGGQEVGEPGPVPPQPAPAPTTGPTAA